MPISSSKESTTSAPLKFVHNTTIASGLVLATSLINPSINSGLYSENEKLPLSFKWLHLFLLLFLFLYISFRPTRNLTTQLKFHSMQSHQL